MPTAKRGRESPATDTDQSPAKRHIGDQTAHRTQDDVFEICTKFAKHYEFDWIENLHGRVKMVKQIHTDAEAHANAGSGFSSHEYEDEEFSDDFEDPSQDTYLELNKDAVGGCDSLLINTARFNFHHDMEEPSVETSALGFELFDRYGRLRPDFKEHPIKKGSGIWGDELNSGPLLLIERALIDKPYRRRGLGQKMIAEVLKEMRSKSESFIALIQPGVIYRDYETLKENLTNVEKEWFFAEEMRVTIAFWRSVGFRRIGASGWFGFASAVDHPCHSLSPSEDYDPPKRTFYSPIGSLLCDIAILEENEALERVKQTFQNMSISSDRKKDTAMESLMIDIANKQDNECIEKLQRTFENVPIDDPRLEVRDDDGNTVLHIAAIKFKPKSVEWIMMHIAKLQDTRNDEQDTPLEALQSHLEVQRTRRGSNYLSVISPVSDEFKGFTENMVACLGLLSGQINSSSLSLKRLTFGCTCGQCIGGFLSPRMRFALLCAADSKSELLRDELDIFSCWDFTELHEDILRHVPRSIRGNMTTNKSLRMGFANLCDHFAACLRGNNLPTPENTHNELEDSAEWPPTSKTFLQRGGTIESVGSVIFEVALQEDDLAGAGGHLFQHGEEVEALSRCRNDHEYGFVSGMCGYKRVSTIRYVSIGL